LLHQLVEGRLGHLEVLRKVRDGHDLGRRRSTTGRSGVSSHAASVAVFVRSWAGSQAERHPASSPPGCRLSQAAIACSLGHWIRKRLLILSQMPAATHVAGLGTWKQMGRFGKKGEKGIVIIAPMNIRPKEDDLQSQDQTDRAKPIF
jgi:hypothetical protein